MLFASIRELSKNISRFVEEKDVVIITKYGKPVRALLDMNEDDLEDFIIAEHMGLAADAHKAIEDSDKNKNLSLHALRRKIFRRK